MTQTIEAIYDGLVLHPDEPLQLEANTRVRLVVEEMPAATSKPQSFLETARSLHLEGMPSDFSENLDHYLYGRDKAEDAAQHK